jgi:hypothetical protein
LLLKLPSLSSAQQETGIPLTKNLYMTGGSHGTLQDGLPAYAYSRFYPGVEKHGLQGENAYSTGLAYSLGESTGIFLDFDGAYELTPAVRSSKTKEAAGPQLKKTRQGVSFGMVTRFFSRGQFFANVSYVSFTNRLATPGGDINDVRKPRARSEMGVRFPFMGKSTFNVIAGIMGGESGKSGSILSGGRLTVDTVFARKTGPFFTVFGVTNLLDSRDNDPFLDANGRHFNPGRNFFISFIHQF